MLIATAPSGFQAGGVDFRAGEYRFSRPNLVVLRAALPGGRYVSMFLTIGIVNPAGDFEAKPITNCCGEKCFLPQV